MASLVPTSGSCFFCANCIQYTNRKKTTTESGASCCATDRNDLGSVILPGRILEFILEHHHSCVIFKPENISKMYLKTENKILPKNYLALSAFSCFFLYIQSKSEIPQVHTCLVFTPKAPAAMDKSQRMSLSFPLPSLFCLGGSSTWNQNVHRFKPCHGSQWLQWSCFKEAECAVLQLCCCRQLGFVAKDSMTVQPYSNWLAEKLRYQFWMKILQTFTV